VLEADLYLRAPGAHAVVLLHMIPPHFERSSWPLPFVERLNAEGYSVLVVDRRGAGKSGGEAKQAYEGEWGRYDVEAAVTRLVAHGVGKLALIGASNGTTSMVDYAVWAPDEGLPVPSVLGFMTGGDYTENQTEMSALTGVPAVFTYATEERDWSVAQQGKADHWVFHEYEGGAHGTKMFAPKPEVTDHLVAAVATALSP
jgi:pimeloyl-ACP methyl ester carboxylesterase